MEKVNLFAKFLKNYILKPMDQAGIKKFWFHRSVFITSYFDASSVVIPEGERFVIASAEKVLGRIRDQELAERAATLLHEEGAHARVHDAYNLMLAREGYSLKYSRVGPRLFNWMKRYLSDTTNVGISMCTEYFTLLFSKAVLEHGVLGEVGVDPRLARLWTWHSMEEIEHRSACFDIFVHIKGGYFRRVCAMLIAAPSFLFITHISHLSLLWQNGGLFRPRVLWNGMGFFFGKNGIYSHLLGNWLKFFRTDFHPSQIAIAPSIQKDLYHHHIEDELVAYFS